MTASTVQTADMLANLRFWVDKFYDQPVYEMNNDQLALFVVTLNADESGVVGVPDTVGEEFVFRIGKNHAEALGLRISPNALAFVTLGLSETPGDIVMWLTALRFRQAERDQHEPDAVLNMLALGHLLPNGYPDQASLNLMWEAQKLVTPEGKPYDLTAHAKPLLRSFDHSAPSQVV